MNEQKGMGHISLVIAIAIIAVVIVGVVAIANTNVKNVKNKNYETDMLVIQGKIKVLAQEAAIQKKDELLKGRKISDYLNNEKFKSLIEKEVIREDEEHYAKYYIVDELDLIEMGLDNIKLSNGYYIVNYDTYEILYSEGIKIGQDIIYKLSELQEKLESKDELNEETKSEETQTQQVSQEQAE